MSKIINLRGYEIEQIDNDIITYNVCKEDEKVGTIVIDNKSITVYGFDEPIIIWETTISDKNKLREYGYNYYLTKAVQAIEIYYKNKLIEHKIKEVKSNMTKTIYLGDYRLELTCPGCPEQYDVFVGAEQVGYLRLRHGYFTVEYPDVGGECIYEAYVRGDGVFQESERKFYLSQAIKKIDNHIKSMASKIRAVTTEMQEREVDRKEGFRGREYEMIINISGFDPKRLDDIKLACTEEWEFTEDDFELEKNSCGSEVLSAKTIGYLRCGETEDEFTDRISIAVWKANRAYCKIEVNALCLQEIPYENYTRDEDDYRRLMEDKVVISVRGGIAYLESSPEGIKVEIVDYDNR